MSMKQNTPKSFRFLFLLFFVAVILAVLFVFFKKSPPPPNANIPQKFSIAVSRTPLSAPFYVAKEKGFFAEEGVTPEFLDLAGGHRCLKAVLDNKADMGTASDLPIMFNSFKRDDYVISATFVTSNNDVKIMATKDSRIQSPKDFSGKKVGVILGASSQFFLDFFLLNNGLSPQDIEVVGLSPEKMPVALANGDVDAISVWEPFGYKAKEMLGENLRIFPHEQIYRETFNLVASRAFHNSNSEIVGKVLKALKKSIEFINVHPAEAQKVVAHELGHDQKFIQWIWDDFHYDLTLDQGLLITLEDEAKWAVKNGLVSRKTIPNYLEFIDTAPLKKVNPSGSTIIY